MTTQHLRIRKGCNMNLRSGDERCMVFMCELAMYIAAVAGGIKLDHAYYWLIGGPLIKYIDRTPFEISSQ